MRPDGAIAAVAAKQHGAFDASQARNVGFSPRMIRYRVSSGRWRSPYRGVYVVCGTPPTWEQRAIVAVLAYGRRAAGSHSTAAHVLEIIEQPPTRLDVSLPRSHHREGRLPARPHQATLQRSDVRIVRGIRVTAPNRTLVDLAGELNERGLEAALDNAIQLGLTTIPSLRAYIVRRRLQHNRGAARLRRLMADRSEGAMHRALERMFRRKVEAAGIPKPKRQYPIGPYRIDFAWPLQKIAVELDGLGGHFSAEKARADKRRDRAIIKAGFTPVHFSWHDIADDWPAAEADLRAVLASVDR